MRPRSFLLLVVILIIASACRSESKPERTRQATAAQPEPTETLATSSATPTLTMAPAEAAAPTETATPAEQATESTPATVEAPPTATLEAAFQSLGPLPSGQEVELSIVDQWGGAPLSMALDGNTAYIGFGPRLFVVDIGNPGEPRLLGRSEILPDLVRGIDVVGGLAYLATGKAGLVLIDASDPTALQIIGAGPAYSGDSPANAHRVTVDGGAAFVVDYNRSNGQSTLLQFDVSDPAQLLLLDSYALPADASVQVAGQLIVVIGSGKLQLRDAAEPGSIMSETPLAAGSYTSRGVVRDHMVIVAECCAPSGIERFDISDPYHPTALGALQEVEAMPPVYAAADGPTLATASTFGEFGFCQSTVNLIDTVGDSAQVSATFDPQNCLNELVLDGDRLYLTGRSGLQIYDLSDPASPTLLGQFRNPDGFHDAQALARHGGLTYVLNAEGRSFDLTTLDLSKQPPDLMLARQNIGRQILVDLFAGDNDTLIAPVWMGSLFTLDISDPAAPQLLHRPAEGELYSSDLFTAATREGVFYTSVIDGVLTGGFGAVDLADPVSPVLTTTVETGDWQVINMALSGDTLYVLSQGEESHVSLYDVSHPAAPALIAMVTMPEFASRLVAVDDALYAACDGHNCQSIYALDVSDKHSPNITARWTIPFGVRNTAIGAEGAFYLVTSDQRIVSLDGRDPEQLRLTGSQLLPGEYIRLEIEGDQIYAATFDGGLYQLQVIR